MLEWKSFTKRGEKDLFHSLGVQHVISQEICVECLGGTPFIWSHGLTFKAGHDINFVYWLDRK